MAISIGGGVVIGCGSGSFNINVSQRIPTTIYYAVFGPQGSGSNVLTPNSSTINLNTTQDFTVELWFYLTSHSALNCALCLNGAGQLGLRIDSAWSSSITGAGVAFTTYPQPSLNTWYHYSITRQSGTVFTHINGTQYASAANSQAVNLSNSLVGNYNNNSNQEWTGRLSNLRISNIARYSLGSSFTPSQYFSSDANTLLLGLNSNAFVDQGANNLGAFTVTAGTNAPTLSSYTI
jgi:hypothetical protein